MSHTPPTPKGAQSPYPLGAAQAADRDAAKHDLAEQAAGKAAAAAKPEASHLGLRIAAGSAIGSAAIAAALIFWNRSKPS